MSALEVDLRLPLARFELETRFDSDGGSLGVFGPSGSGKTSLLEAIVGLRDGARGRIRVAGETWLEGSRGRPPEARDVGYVPQGARLFPHLTTEGNLRVGARRARARGQDAAALRAHTVELLELGPLLSQSVETLSGGERQRVALGRALCSAPRLLVLDEPLASLDPASRRRLLPFLRRIRDESRIPMLLVSHAPLEIAALCERVIVLDHGRIRSIGSPADEFARAYVGDALGDEALETVLPATVVVSEPARTRVRLGGSAVELEVRASPSVVEGATLVAIAADAVILARGEVGETSAANLVVATVSRIDAGERRVVVHLALGDDLPELAVELVAGTAERMGLVVGERLRAQFKASACRLLG